MSQISQDRVKKYLSASGTVRVSIVRATHLVNQMQSVHKKMSPLASVAMGRTMISAALLSAHHKNGKIGIHFQGNGPLGEVYAESSYDGSIRGYIKNPQADLALVDGKIDISTGIGIGLLNVVRTLPYQKQPFSGTVIIKTGEIGSDIAYYLEQSHQIPSVVALGEFINEYGMLTAAGGLIVELMPGHTEVEVDTIENNLKVAKSFSKMITDNYNETQVLDEYLKGIPLLPIEHEVDLEYSCTCTMDKVLSSLVFMGEQNLEEMLRENKPAEVVCEFCSKVYSVDQKSLYEVYQNVKKKGLH